MKNPAPDEKVRLANNPEKASMKPSARSGLKSSVMCLLVAGWFTISGFTATHPLEPLSTNELRFAIDVLLKENKISTNSLIPIVVLQEPPKEEALAWKPGMTIRRQAFAVTYDLPTHRTHEAIVDLDRGQVTSWRHQPGVEPLQTLGELEASSRILQTNAMWIAALQRRGITNLALVDSSSVPGALIPFRGAENVRLLRTIPFRRQINRLLWEPIEGLSAVVDMTHQKVLEVADHEIIPRSTNSMDLFDPAVRGGREALKPLVTTQPQGANFVVRDHEVVWDHWRFRYSMHPREGLVLHQVGWEEAPGKVRSILYRASLSDLLAPYADTDPAWSWRAFFDESDFGLGYYASPLVRGITTAAHATLLSEPMPDPKGNGDVIEAADLVDIYERDAGTLWAHYDSESHASVGPRARELVIGYLTTVGNYDYRLQWSFRQDGAIEFHVYLTGIMLTKGTHAATCAACAAARAGKAGVFTAPGEQAHGVLVADHLLAPHHQHFFNLRLDFDVDGVQNSVEEFNLRTDRRGRANPHGNGFSLSQTIFARERDAVRNLNLESHRMWAVFNPNSISVLGHPAAYLIEPGMNTVPFLAPDSAARKRAGFMEHHFFATRYRATELNAGGNYPVSSGPPNNILNWTRDNERIQNEDVVVWYTFGVTHVARPEDFPVMPSAHASVRLLPKGFFNRNPAMDVPDTPQVTATP